MTTKPRRRSAITALFAATIALLLVLPSFASADPLDETTMFKEGLKEGTAWVRNMSPGPDGNVWFTDATLPPPAIGRITPGGAITEYCEAGCTNPLSGLSPESKPVSITAGPGGEKYLWFTDNGPTPAIGYVDSASPETAVEIPLKAGSEPQGIVAGPGGKLWFTDEGTTPAIVAVDPSSKEVVKECTGGDLEAESRPHGIVVGSDGNLWFVDSGETRAIGKVDPNTCAITEFPTGTNSDPGGGVGAEGGWGIGSGADGNIWFTERGTNEANGKAVCRIETSGENKIKCFKTGLLASSNPTAMTSAPDGAGKLWFADISFVNEKQELKIEDSGTLGGTYKLGFKGEETGATFTGKTTSGSKKIESIASFVGTISKGELVTGAGIPAGDTVKAITGSPSSPTKIELTANATETKAGVSLSADLRFDASGTVIKEALEKLPSIGLENIGSEGSGSTSPVTRTIRFEFGLGAADVEQVSCNGTGLTGTSPTCTVTTLEPGVPNEIASIDTSGAHEIIRYPRKELFLGGNAITNGPGGNVWFSVGFPPFSEIGKFGIEPPVPPGPTNRRTLTLTKSPAGNEGAGLGSVSSKPKGINCATTCSKAVGRMYENSTVVLTEKPSGELSKFKEWTGACSGSGTTCTVSMTAEKEVGAVFEGSSKAFSPAEALTLSKGESEQNFGWGTVKATGLTCEAECDSATVLYQGPITLPKPKAGKTVELKETPAFGSKFVGWSGACSGTEPTCKVEMSEAKSVTAEFAEQPGFALTIEKKYEGGLGSVSSKPKGISCGTTCTATSANMPKGTSVLLTAKPATTTPATTFVKWEGGDCEGKTETTCTVGMDKAETVKAVFSGTVKAINEAKALTLAKEGSGFGTVKATGLTCEVLCTSATSLYYGPVTLPKVKAGATVTLKATSAPGSKVVEWGPGCKTNPTPSECVVEMSEDKSITATFDELK